METLFYVLGVCVLIGVVYGLLKNYGLTTVIKIIAAVPICAFLSACAVAVILHLFGADFATVRTITFWPFLILWVIRGVKKIREEVC